jgi:hypothetical protein
MDFFDKKQEVFEINLTPDGKKSLSNGDLKFEYYSFHDTDIVYDPSYLELTMSSNTQTRRIQDDRQVIRPNLTSKSIEEFNNKLGTNTVQHRDLVHCFLGTSELGQKYYPALEIRCVKGEFSPTYSYETNVYTSQRVPQVYITINNSFDDRTKQWVIDEPIVLAANEINGKKEKKNFMAEFFYVIPGVGTRPTGYYPIKFKQQNYEPSQFSSEIDLPEEQGLEPTEIDYYFSVQVDHKILSDIEFRSLPPERQQELRSLLYDAENTAVIC